MAGFSAEAVLVRTAEALDATSGARGQTGRQQDDAEDRSILGRESAEEAAWLGLSVRVPRGPLHPGLVTISDDDNRHHESRPRAWYRTQSAVYKSACGLPITDHRSRALVSHQLYVS